eukprot:2049937-Pleurochrysis_carterae.AAC.1
MALKRSKSLPVLPPDAIPLESKHRNRVSADSGHSERPNTVLATVSYASTRRRARSPARVAMDCSGQSFSTYAGAVETDTGRIGTGASDEPRRTSSGDPSANDAQQHAEHLEKVRALHEKWNQKYDDL